MATKPKNTSRVTLAQFLSAYTRIPNNMAPTRLINGYQKPREGIIPNEFNAYAVIIQRVPIHPMVRKHGLIFFILLIYSTIGLISP